jgi:hypothetical protein
VHGSENLYAGAAGLEGKWRGSASAHVLIAGVDLNFPAGFPGSFFEVSLFKGEQTKMIRSNFSGRNRSMTEKFFSY